MRPFRILSIDGGGLRGIIPVMILQYIEQKTGKRIIDIFDMIAGTSTGGLIACGLTVSDDHKTPKHNLQDVANIYLEKGSTIFPIRNTPNKILNDVESMLSPEFSDSGINSVLTDFFGDLTLNDCLLPLFISSYDVNNNQCVFFKSRCSALNSLENAKLFDVCRATSSAPTYLPAHSFNFNNQDLTCIDGGIYINNPAIGATVEVHKYWDSNIYNSDGKWENSCNWEDIHVLSLATGQYNGQITKTQNVKWGELQWVTRIIDIMMYGVSQTTDYEMSELLKNGNYLRIGINITDEKYNDMSDARTETMQYLQELVSEQFLNNKLITDQLDNFLTKAGI